MPKTIDVTPTRLPQRFNAAEAMVSLRELELIQARLVEWTPRPEEIAVAEEFRIPDDDSGQMLQLAVDEFRNAMAKFDENEARRKKSADVLNAWIHLNQGWFNPVLDGWKRIADSYNKEGSRRRRQLEDDRRKAQAKIDEDNRRARAAAEAKAAKERADAAKAAEELQRKAREAEAAGRAGEAAKLNVQAENKIEAGEMRAQAAVVDAAAAAPAVVLPPAPKVAGATTVRNYDIEEDIDVFALMRYVLANPHFKNAVLPNKVFLRQQAISMKDGFNIGGCTLKVTESMRRSGR